MYLEEQTIGVGVNWWGDTLFGGRIVVCMNNLAASLLDLESRRVCQWVDTPSMSS